MEVSQMLGRISLFFISFAAAILLGCAPDFASDKSRDPQQDVTYRNVTVSWTGNNGKGVNSTGGGYRVHYSTTSNFNVNGSLYVDVPFTSGSAAPTYVQIKSLTPGTRYYFKVVAYSALNSGSLSSGQVSVLIPEATP